MVKIQHSTLRYSLHPNVLRKMFNCFIIEERCFMRAQQKEEQKNSERKISKTMYFIAVLSS